MTLSLSLTHTHRRNTSGHRLSLIDSSLAHSSTLSSTSALSVSLVESSFTVLTAYHQCLISSERHIRPQVSSHRLCIRSSINSLIDSHSLSPSSNGFCYEELTRTRHCRSQVSQISSRFAPSSNILLTLAPSLSLNIHSSF
jgi:hypothetical protein